MKIKHRLIASTVLFSCIGFVGLAQAQDNKTKEAATKLEVIVVTATKRETALTDTAIAITAFTKDTRDRLGIAGIQDIADITPGMTVQDAPNRISMRGVGRLTNALGSDPGVGIYTDGIYTSETAGVSVTTLTNERIEVLRGPQGTLYGRNTIGGAVNAISIRPTEEREGQVRARVGNFDQIEIGAAASGAISDNARVRLVASHNEHAGYIKNVGFGQDQWAEDSNYAEAQLEWDATEDLQVWLKYAYFEQDTTPRQPVVISPYRSDVVRGDLIVNPTFGLTEQNPSVNDPFTVALNETGSLNISNSHSVTAHVDWDFDKVSFKYMGGWSQYDYTTTFDNDNSNRRDNITLIDPALGAPVFVPASTLNDIGESKEWSSHDFQLTSNSDSGPEWIIGAYYYEEDVFQPFALRQPGNAFLADPRIITPEAPSSSNLGFGFRWSPSEPNPNSHYYYQDGELNSKSTAIYGQISFDVSEKVTLTGGLRYSKDEKTGSEHQRVIFDQLAYSFDPQILAGVLGGVLPPPTSFYGQYSVDVTGGTLFDSHSGEWDAVTGMAAIEYRPNDDSLWYLNVSQGYKSGGFRLGGLSDIQATPGVNEAEVGEEEILSIELGNKISIGDAIQLNSALYFYDYTDLQAEVGVRRFGINLIELFNAKDSEVFGFETEAMWQMGANTNLIASYSYSDSEYTDFCGDSLSTNPDGSQGCLVDPLAAAGDTNLVDPTGNALNKAPKQKFAAILSHGIPLKNGLLSLSATYSYVGSQFYSVFNHESSKVGGYDRVDARVSFYDDQQRYQVHGYIRNAFDNESATGSGSSGAPFFGVSQSYNAPRTVGAEIQVNF
ncbi:MAG: iron complex outermembrane receptor protein [Cryomorphaceae bacterium]|jgi:iron complex outermembrane receptor protein